MKAIAAAVLVLLLVCASLVTTVLNVLCNVSPQRIMSGEVSINALPAGWYSR